MDFFCRAVINSVTCIWADFNKIFHISQHFNIDVLIMTNYNSTFTTYLLVFIFHLPCTFENANYSDKIPVQRKTIARYEFFISCHNFFRLKQLRLSYLFFAGVEIRYSKINFDYIGYVLVNLGWFGIDFNRFSLQSLRVCIWD